jgi:hypothetical protein
MVIELRNRSDGERNTGEIREREQYVKWIKENKRERVTG